MADEEKTKTEVEAVELQVLKREVMEIRALMMEAMELQALKDNMTDEEVALMILETEVMLQRCR